MVKDHWPPQVAIRSYHPPTPGVDPQEDQVGDRRRREHAGLLDVAQAVGQRIDGQGPWGRRSVIPGSRSARSRRRPRE